MASDTTRTRRPLVVAAIMLATFMNAIEATIVATAMPRIVGELGDFTHYSWVFSAYLLAQTTTNVIYGKLADMFGRKPALICGIVLFLLGSLLCGFATSMFALIGFRLIQGLGAGAIQPITMTIVGDLYTLEERPKIQGILSGVWATSAVIGPQLGAVIIENLPWSWLFWVNLPIGVVAIAGFVLFLHEKVEHQKRKIDYLGALLFAVAVVSFLSILTETGAEPVRLAELALVFVASAVLFVWHERRTQEPMVPIDALEPAPRRDLQHRDRVGRHGADRPHHHPAALCAGHIGPLAFGRRLDLDDAHARLALGGDLVGTALPHLRRAQHLARREPRLSARRGAARAAHAAEPLRRMPASRPS